MVQSQGRDRSSETDHRIQRILKDPEAQGALANLRKAGVDLGKHTITTYGIWLFVITFAFSSQPDELSAASDLIWRIQRTVERSTGRPHDNDISHLLSVARKAADQAEYTIDAGALKMRRWRERFPLSIN